MHIIMSVQKKNSCLFPSLVVILSGYAEHAKPQSLGIHPYA